MNHYIFLFFFLPFFFKTALPRTIAPAPLLRLRQLCWYKTGNCILPPFLLHRRVEGCKCIFKSNISQRSPSFHGRLRLHGSASFNWWSVRSCLASLSLSVFFFFFFFFCNTRRKNRKKKSQLPTVPWSVLVSEVRLHRKQSALIRGRWGAEGRGLRWDGRIPARVVTFVKVTIIHVCGCRTEM